MQGATPIVTWEPNLNDDGVERRLYKVYGSESLENGGEWQYLTNSLHRFFKVTVEMPQARRSLPSARRSQAGGTPRTSP